MSNNIDLYSVIKNGLEKKGGGIQYKFSNKIFELLEQGILRKVEH